MSGKQLTGAGVRHDWLKKFTGDPKEVEEDEEEANDRYQVTGVHDVRTTDRGQEYLVKWTRYPTKEWELADNLKGAERAVELFWKRRNNEEELAYHPARRRRE